MRGCCDVPAVGGGASGFFFLSFLAASACALIESSDACCATDSFVDRSNRSFSLAKLQHNRSMEPVYNRGEPDDDDDDNNNMNRLNGLEGVRTNM